MGYFYQWIRKLKEGEDYNSNSSAQLDHNLRVCGDSPKRWGYHAQGMKEEYESELLARLVVLEGSI